MIDTNKNNIKSPFFAQIFASIPAVFKNSENGGEDLSIFRIAFRHVALFHTRQISALIPAIYVVFSYSFQICVFTNICNKSH